jgi:hypothetical protein
MSSAILYIAIVAIWAFVLIPRWLRRPHLLGGETAEPEVVPAGEMVPEPVASRRAVEFVEAEFAEAAFVESAYVESAYVESAYVDSAFAESAFAESGAAPGPPPPAERGSRRTPAAPPTRPRVLQARRRLLTMLLTLAVAAGVCTYMKLTSWWVCVPPAGMLGIYLLLLREAALADAELARRRAAESWRAQAARRVAPIEQTAEVIDISDRLSDQLYDQYADATIRAVGD